MALCSQESPAISAVDSVFKEENKAGQPGCGMGVVQHGTLALSRFYGLADVERDVPLTSESRFDIASMTKQFTAMDVLLLAAQNKLNLHDDVRKYIPELPNYGQPITIEQMIHHTSGLKDVEQLLDLAGWRRGDLITVHDVLSIVARQTELNFAPGTKYLYSNTNYILLGLIVERLSGSSLQEFNDRNIFQPLGMTHTVFRGNTTSLIPQRATGYRLADGQARLAIANGEAPGASGVVTTVSDLALWDQNFYDGRVGGPGVIAEMQTVPILADGSPGPYAGGLFLGNYHGVRIAEHDGEGAGSASDLLRFPDRHLSIIVLCNRTDVDINGLTRKVAELYLPNASNPDVLSATDQAKGPDPGAFAGTYWSSNLVLYRRFAVQNGKLIDPGTGSAQKRVGPTTFVSPGGALYNFTLSKDGIATGIDVSWPGGIEHLHGTFQQVREAATDPATLQKYSGIYVSSELGVAWCIYMRDKTLMLRRSRFDDLELVPKFEDGFEGDYAYLVFARKGNEVTGLSAVNFRLKSASFQRLSPDFKLVPQLWDCPQANP